MIKNQIIGAKRGKGNSSQSPVPSRH